MLGSQVRSREGWEGERTRCAVQPVHESNFGGTQWADSGIAIVKQQQEKDNSRFSDQI